MSAFFYLTCTFRSFRQKANCQTMRSEYRSSSGTVVRSLSFGMAASLAKFAVQRGWLVATNLQLRFRTTKLRCQIDRRFERYPPCFASGTDWRSKFWIVAGLAQFFVRRGWLVAPDLQLHLRTTKLKCQIDRQFERYPPFFAWETDWLSMFSIVAVLAQFAVQRGWTFAVNPQLPQITKLRC